MELHSEPTSATAQSPTSDSLPPRWQRMGLNVLASLLLVTIGWCNLPDELPEQAVAALTSRCSPEVAYRIRWGEWLWKWGAHLAGLDNKWQMYGLQSRFNWRYEIIATYGEGEQAVDRLLPLPRQSARTLWQRWVVDFKEAKFHLNIYNDPLARETYAHYLARQYPQFEGRRLEQIRFDLNYQFILPPLVAEMEQQLLDDRVQVDTVSRFDLAPVIDQLLGPESQPLLPPAWQQAVTSSR